MLDVVEHLICQSGLPPAALRPGKLMLWIAVMVNRPDGKETGEAFAHHHGNHKELESRGPPSKNGHDVDNDCRPLPPDPPPLLRPRELMAFAIERNDEPGPAHHGPPP